MTPAAQLATGTLTMPAGAVLGQKVSISTSQRIVAFTLNPNTGQTIVTAPASNFLAGTAINYIMDSANAWHVI